MNSDASAAGTSQQFSEDNTDNQFIFLDEIPASSEKYPLSNGGPRGAEQEAKGEAERELVWDVTGGQNSA